MGSAVEGVILDSSGLLIDNDGAPTFRPGADFIFRTLQFSQLRKGIAFGRDLSDDQVKLLGAVSKEYSFNCFHSNPSDVEALVSEITLAWGDVGVKSLYVVSSHNKDLSHKLFDRGLLSVLEVDVVEDNKHPSINHIKKLEELPLYICRWNRKAAGKDIVIVGYNMKPSRQIEFAKRGAFPLSQQELIFLPITYDLPMPLQLQEMDVVLHKATDDIVSVDFHASALAPNISYTNGLQDLKRTLEDYPHCCVIDPFNSILPVVDRLKIQHVLVGLEDLNRKGHSMIRGPHFLKVDNYNDPKLTERLLEAKLSLPSIVKPQVACGVSNAHSMAIVFSVDDYKDLGVPLPAIVQEYVDHSSTLFKFYVVGEKVFHAVKKSIPNGDILRKLSQGNPPKPLLFDSLKSLPTSEKIQFGDEAVDLELVNEAAHWLRRKLDLTIFGFDVVIQKGTCDHVIVDVNYLPSFKEIPDNIAIPAFWEAIKNKLRERQQTLTGNVEGA